MNQSDAFQVLGSLAVISVLGWSWFVTIRYWVRRCRRNQWPSTDAVIQRGALGRVSVGKGTVFAGFMGYAYKVEGARYGGFFVLLGRESTIEKLHGSLAGSHLLIRYDPSDPNISFLVDYKDLRFEGLSAKQNPELLSQAPAFDLQDAIRGDAR